MDKWLSNMKKVNTRKVKVGDHYVLTYSYGDGDKVIMLVHGGPGSPSDYLFEAHKNFAKYGYRIVTWDQLGCGKSDRPNDKNLWTIKRYVEETETVRKSLNLHKINLLGHSWGGILGLEYCFKFPENVSHFIASNTAFDLPMMQRGFERKKLSLGEQTYLMMTLREAEGTTDHPEYKAASTILMYRHMCRLESWPNALVHTLNDISKDVWGQMFGPYFFNCTGSLKNYNKIEKLCDLVTPTTLFTSEHDYILPDISIIARDRIPNSNLIMFKNCSHMPFYENKKEYYKALSNVLSP